MRASQSQRALSAGGYTPPSPLHVSWDGAGIAVDDFTGITYVCGGLDASVNDVGSFGKVLRFTPSSCVWDYVECGGEIPPPRRHHTMCFFNRRLVVCGGELINEQRATLSENATSEKGDIALGKENTEEQVPFLLSSKSVGALEVYVLDLNTCCWSAFTYSESAGEGEGGGNEGEAPISRHYHTSTVVGNAMLVIGGKPTLAATKASGIHLSGCSFTCTCTSKYVLTNASMLELKTHGFYNVHVLHLETMKWKRLSSSQSSEMPFLWGHAAVHMKESGLIAVVGGVDVKASGDIAKRIPTTFNDLPEAMPNTSVYLLDVRYMSWSYFTPLGTTDLLEDHNAKCPPLPPACAGITAVNIPNTDELLICNGWSIGATTFPSAKITEDRLCPPAALSPKPNTAAYIYNLVSRRWRQISWPPAPLENYVYTSTCADKETDKASRCGCSLSPSHMYRPSIVITCPPLLGLTEEREQKGHREYEEGRSDGQPRQKHRSSSRSQSDEFVAVVSRIDVLAALDCRLVPRLQGWRRVVTQFAPSVISKADFSKLFHAHAVGERKARSPKPASSQRVSLPREETLAPASARRLASQQQAKESCDDLDASRITIVPQGLLRKHVALARYNRLIELEKTAERMLEKAETQSSSSTQFIAQVGNAASSSAQVEDEFTNHIDLAAFPFTETSSLKLTLEMLRKERKKAARTIRKEALN